MWDTQTATSLETGPVLLVIAPLQQQVNNLEAPPVFSRVVEADAVVVEELGRGSSRSQIREQGVPDPLARPRVALLMTAPNQPGEFFV
jgi:hypothetical protein